MSGVRLVEAGGYTNTQEVVMANSASIDTGDFVVIDGDGFLARAAATEKIQGVFVEESKSVASNNESVGLITGKYQPIVDEMTFELTSDQAPVATDRGAYCDIAVSGGGVITANLAAGATGQLEVIAIDIPNTKVKVQVAEPQQLAFAQS